MQLVLSNVVQSYSSNDDGLKLFIELERQVSTDEEIMLVVANEVAFSSSFLNSSIGLFLEKYGMDTFRKKVKFKGNKNQFEYLGQYIKNFEKAHLQG